MNMEHLLYSCGAALLWLPFAVYWMWRPCRRTQHGGYGCCHRLGRRLGRVHWSGIMQSLVMAVVSFCYVGEDAYCKTYPHKELAMYHATLVWLFTYVAWLLRFVHMHPARTLIMYVVLQLHMAVFWVSNEVAFTLVQLALLCTDWVALRILSSNANHNIRYAHLFFLLPSLVLWMFAECVIVAVGFGSNERLNRLFYVLVLFAVSLAHILSIDVCGDRFGIDDGIDEDDLWIDFAAADESGGGGSHVIEDREIMEEADRQWQRYLHSGKEEGIVPN